MYTYGFGSCCRDPNRSTGFAVVQATFPQSAPSGATPNASPGFGAKLNGELLVPTVRKMFDPGGGPWIGPGSKKQHRLAPAKNGVVCRMFVNTVSNVRLYTMPNPPRNTLPPIALGLQAKPKRG